MPPYLPFVLVGIFFAGLVAWRIAAHRRKRQVDEAALDRLGFVPCPEQKAWLQETIARIENNRGYRYDVRDPKRLPGEPAVYRYVKVRHGSTSRDDPLVDEEILFPLKRPSAAGLVLTVKPSSIAAGRTSRLLGTLATADWDAQPDDLHRLELPVELRETNLIGALAPDGSRLYDLVDSRTLGVVQGLGDLGVLTVQFRDDWCAMTTAGDQVSFRLDEVVARIRALQ